VVEYTGLEKSKQLAKMQFMKKDEGYPCDAIYMGKYDYSLDTSFVEQFANTKLYEYPAYRADTLLSWLLGRGYFEYIMANAADEIVVAFSDSAFPIGTVETRAKTLADALADVVFTVLASRPR